jgi:hypothetical protein
VTRDRSREAVEVTSTRAPRLTLADASDGPADIAAVHDQNALFGDVVSAPASRALPPARVSECVSGHARDARIGRGKASAECT